MFEIIKELSKPTVEDGICVYQDKKYLTKK